MSLVYSTTVQAEAGGPDFEALLRAHGIRPTSQRLAVARVLLDQPRHLSADRLMERVNRRRATVSLATVYNTLKLFAAHGLVKPVLVKPGRIYYDSNTLPHHHFYNEDTGELFDFGGTLTVRGSWSLPPGTEAVGMNVIVRVRTRATDRPPGHGPE